MTPTTDDHHPTRPATPGAFPERHRVAVVGYGLIGASLARGLHAQQACGRLSVWDRSATAMAAAATQLGTGAVADSLAGAVRDADLVFVAVPTHAFASVLREILPAVSSRAVVSDVASVKVAIVETVGTLPKEQRSRFVPAHPIAGSERSGALHADAGLFVDRQVILTPTGDTGGEHVATLRRFWRGLGSRVTTMSPGEHDRIFGAVSHLPHLIAFAYLGALAATGDGRDCAPFAGPGLRDFTRIAGADPALWADICVSNRHELERHLGAFRAHLDRLDEALSSGDRAALADHFARARGVRSLFEGRDGPAAPARTTTSTTTTTTNQPETHP